MAARLNIFSILPDNPSDGEETHQPLASQAYQKQKMNEDQIIKKARNRKGISRWWKIMVVWMVMYKTLKKGKKQDDTEEGVKNKAKKSDEPKTKILKGISQDTLKTSTEQAAS